ncbi:MAG: LLM class flavin-dependent oxidoreductase [Albidovulum sp.]
MSSWTWPLAARPPAREGPHRVRLRCPHEAQRRRLRHGRRHVGAAPVRQPLASERLGGEAPDPLVAMSFAAGRTTRLKFGMSVMVLPGRNPVVLAKELATLDRLSNGRLSPAFGLGVADPHEQQAFGVARTERAAWFDESMAVLRVCAGSGKPVNHHGARYQYDDLRVLPTPRQEHLDVWLGGIAPFELRRVARLSDGWLPSFVTPDDAARGREVIEAGLAEHGRSIEPDHYGALIPYVGADDVVPEALLAGLAETAARPRRPVRARAPWVGCAPRAHRPVRRGRHLEIRGAPARRARDTRRVGCPPRGCAPPLLPRQT